MSVEKPDKIMWFVGREKVEGLYLWGGRGVQLDSEALQGASNVSH